MQLNPFLPDFQISELTLGTLPLSGSYGPITEEQAVNVIRKAIDLGVNLVDTADIYGKGQVEQIVGRTIPQSKPVKIVTKVGRDWYTRNGEWNWSAEYLKFAVTQSILRLGRTQLDVCLLHNPDVITISRGEVFSTMEDLRREGLIKYWGVSVSGFDEAILSLSVAHPYVLQIYANQAEPQDLEKLDPIILSSYPKVGIMVRMPLGGGLLTGSYTLTNEFDKNDYRMLRGVDWINKLTRFSMENVHQSRRERITNAFKYLLDYKSVSSLVCGMHTVEQVKEDIAAICASRPHAGCD